ncbi:serine/threonine-protein kinase [Paraliomyxa miuraensis]|uniref:serine/threonine-protein kinase n=1 Tax=Paraliomyxa miuraensis TaxID=376150 RepID=UPI00225609CF|nr:serine/threonine-protein kinase [Paraliomyxa miuraensis]MCX4244003.1 protein kinase [Paraliomyxa miuraensis]
MSIPESPLLKGLLEAGQEQAAKGEWSPGQVLLGKYRLLEPIGSGGMGVVFAAQRLSLGDVVAIKSIRSERTNERDRPRFMREARALARIRHPNVVQVFDFGESEDGRPFMVMELLDGPTLSQVLAEGRLPLARALELFVDICRAIEAGHRRGVVHRDLKPGNVMFDHADDGAETVKVLDFGLARFTEDAIEQSRAGLLVGTCAYMSPEQIERGAGGPAADVFALGVMLYELVVGERPFDAGNPVTTIMRICDGEYPAPRSKVPNLPDGVVEAITAALQKSADARPGSPLELASLAVQRPLTFGPTTVASRIHSDTRLRSLAGDSLSGDARSVADEDVGRKRGDATEVMAHPFDDDGIPMPRTHAGSDLVQSAARTGSGPMAAASSTLDSGSDSVSGPISVGPSADSSGGSTTGHGAARSHPAIATAPFVGRRLELESLLDLLAASGQGENPIAVVLGEPGMGRTRLLRRFSTVAREQGAVVLEGRFWGYEADRAAPGETYARMLGAAGQGVLPGEPRSEVSPGFDSREGSARLAAAFESLAKDCPLVLVLDDLHFAARSDLEFLTYLVRGRQRAVPVVVVASARTLAARSDAQTELSRWLLQLASLKARTTFTLTPFDPDELRAWLDGVFGRLRIHPRDLRRLHRASAGNPYFLSEMVRHLVASEQITRVDEPGGSTGASARGTAGGAASGKASGMAGGIDGWVCQPLRRNVLPEGVRSVVADQLSTLDEGLRAVLETAAVLGEQFRFDVLQQVLERAKTPLPRELDDLVDDAVSRDLLAEHRLEGDADLRFRNATIRKVLYELLGARRRRRMHQHVVEALVDSNAPQTISRRLAWHYREIGDWPNTLRWGLHAARERLVRYDHDAAEAVLDHAATALEAMGRGAEQPSPRDRIELEALRGTLDVRLGRFGEGLTRLRATWALLEGLRGSSESDADGDAEVAADADADAEDPSLTELRFEVALELARCNLGLGELDRAVRRGHEALELVGTLVGDELRREADWNARIHLGNALGRLGAWERASEILRPVVQASPVPRHRVLHVLALRELAWVEARRGKVGDATRHASQAADEARACNDPVAEYHAASVMAVVQAATGDWPRAVANYQEALRGARALSLRRREMIELANLALAQVEVGELDDALRNILAVIGLNRELGDAASAADARVGLGKVLAARGELEEAIAQLRRGHKECEAVGRHEYAAIALFELGRCELARSHWSSARELLLMARDRLAELGSLFHWEVELALAQAARGSGDDEALLAHINVATELLEEQATGAKLERGLAAIRELLEG